MNIGINRIQGTGAGSFGKVIGSAFVVASMLGHPTTSKAYFAAPLIKRSSASPNNAVFSSTSSEISPSIARGILAIRQIANLTWDETAKLFGVTRRTVHLWANGRHPSGDQERKLNRILGIFSSHQNLSPSSLRARLMASAQPGTLFFDLICNNEFDVFQSLFSNDKVRNKFSPPSLLSGPRAYIAPSPVLLLDALQDRPVRAGGVVAKKSVRLKTSK